MFTMEPHETARKLHDALAAVGSRGSVREHEGRWFVELLPGTYTHPNVLPAVGAEEEWLSALTDRLETVAGVRPLLSVQPPPLAATLATVPNAGHDEDFQR